MIALDNPDKEKKTGVNLQFPIHLTSIDSKVTLPLPEDCIAIADKVLPKDCFTYMAETGVRKVIQKTSKEFEKRVQLAGNLICNPGGFLDDPFTNYFGSKNAFKVKRWDFRSSAEKRNVIEDINQYIPTIAGAKTLGETICLVVDELFTNALFNAPFGETDYALDRNLVVVLDKDKTGQIAIAHDDKNIFLSCIDQFGTLDCTGLIQRTQRNLNSGLGTTINMGPGGAGVGLIRAIEFSSDIIIVIERGLRSFVGFSIELFGSAKGARLCPKNFFFENYRSETHSSNTTTVSRGTSLIARLGKNAKGNLFLEDVDFKEAFEAVLDMRRITSLDENDEKQLLALIKTSPQLRKLSFEYVNTDIVDALKPLLLNHKKLEVRSLICNLECSACKKTQQAIIRLHPSSSNIIKHSEKCLSCGHEIEKDLNISLPA